MRVDRDGNPRGDDVFADDAYPLRWVRLVTTEHQLAFGNRPSGAYVACATEAKSWEAANEAFSRRESRGRKRSSIVFYESLHLEFLESKHDVEYLDLHRYPHPGAASVPPGLADLAAVAEGLADRVAPEPRAYDDGVRAAKPTGTERVLNPPVADPVFEEVRALRARLERIARRLRAEREERRLNETRLAAALRETRRALERAGARAVAERETFLENA